LQVCVCGEVEETTSVFFIGTRFRVAQGPVSPKYLKATFLIRTFVGALLNLQAVSQNHRFNKAALKHLFNDDIRPPTFRTAKYVVRCFLLPFCVTLKDKYSIGYRPNILYLNI
jgi:hypothetical protein